MTQELQKSHLLIAGCGYIGRRVAMLCKDTPDGAHLFITGTAGSTAGLEELRRSGIAGMRLDLDRAVDWPGPPQPWSLLYMVPPAGGSTGDLRLGRLLGALEANLPRRIVYVSTSGVYGDRGGALVNEDDKPTPRTGRAMRRLDAETRIKAFAETNKLPWVILRVPGIYGPGRLRLGAIERGEPILREADCGPGNRIHRDDLAWCCLAALATPNSNRVFNVCDDEHASSCAFSLELARQAGLPAPQQITLAEARKRFGAMRLSFLEESRRLDNRRMHNRLGVELRYPDMASGIAASL